MRTRKEVNAFMREPEENRKVSVVRHSVVCEGSLTYGGKNTIYGPKVAVELANQLFRNSDREITLVCSLNTKNQPLTIEIVAIGTVNACMVGVAEAFKTAIVSNAAGIMLFHNHPSGVCAPSNEDVQLTQRFIDAGNLLGIALKDHIICGTDGKYFSFKENGVIDGF